MNLASKLFSWVLVALSAGMLAWGVLGFIEYFTGAALLMPLQNPNFPAGTQFIHWFLATAAGLVFLVGYFSRWRHTPTAMMVIYACLSTMCFIETFDFMTRADRYQSYVQEVIYYVIITTYLFKSERMRARFAPGTKEQSAELPGYGFARS